MKYGFTVLLTIPFDDVIRRTVTALEKEGFGVLTEIDVQAAVKDKLGIYRTPYLIFWGLQPRLRPSGN